MSKLDIKEHMVFVAMDGDNIGNQVGRAVLDNDFETLHAVSKRIDHAQELITRWVKDNDGVKISGGGDECTAAIPQENVSDIERLRKDIEHTFEYTISVGIGKTLSEAGKALLIAKLQGKNRIVQFDETTEKQIRDIKKRAKKGAVKNMQEFKITEAYLKKSEEDCQYCQQTDGADADHCKYCHDAEQLAGQDDCQYCAQSESIATDDCQYCKEQENEGDCQYCNAAPVASPDSQDEEAATGSEEERAEFESMGMNPPEIGKPTMYDHAPIGQNAPMDMESVLPAANEQIAAGSAGIDPEDDHSKGALLSIAQQIEAEGNPTANEVNSIDETQMASGDDAEGNISRPAGYEQNVGGDTGLSGTNGPTGEEEEEPNFSDILSMGLESSASEIKKEKAIASISQALMQFKACKDVLESIKMQAPQLYQANLAMLRAMIEMAEMLQLNQGAAPQELGAEQDAMIPEDQENEWSNPFPTHPDQGGTPMPGHAPSSQSQDNAEGAIGQSIGKLSSKHTTEHVARTTMPPGAVNGNGQQKVIDPKTGKTRWIDRKKGMVQSASGVPIKPPSRGNDVPQN